MDLLQDMHDETLPGYTPPIRITQYKVAYPEASECQKNQPQHQGQAITCSDIIRLSTFMQGLKVQYLDRATLDMNDLLV